MTRNAATFLCAIGALACSHSSAIAQCDQPNLQALLATDADKDFHEIGKSVAISGRSLVIGAPHNSALGLELGTGDVYTYEFVERRWTDGVRLNDLLPGSTLAVDDGFGEAVAIDGNTIAVGAPFHDDNDGAVFVFTRASSGSAWTFKTEIAGTEGDAQFGVSVALAGDRLAIGAAFANVPGVSDAGAVLVYDRDTEGTWGLTATIDAEGTERETLARFGAAVALSFNRLLVGAPNKDRNSDSDVGAAYVFELNSSVWTRDAVLLADDGSADDLFGSAIAMDFNSLRAAVGAPREDSSANNAGATYIFEHDLGQDEWSQDAKLIPAFVNANGRSGSGVALQGDELVIGAPNIGTSKAAIYHYDGASWDHTGTIAGETIGASIAIDDHLVIIGEPEFKDFAINDRTGRAVYQYVSDCDDDGANDACVFMDCNMNGIPDECDAVGNDCDDDGIPDECEPDCNQNDVPDDCELSPSSDADDDGILDCCECACLDLVFLVDRNVDEGFDDTADTDAIENFQDNVAMILDTAANIVDDTSGNDNLRMGLLTWEIVSDASDEVEVLLDITDDLDDFADALAGIEIKVGVEGAGPLDEALREAVNGDGCAVGAFSHLEAWKESRDHCARIIVVTAKKPPGGCDGGCTAQNLSSALQWAVDAELKNIHLMTILENTETKLNACPNPGNQDLRALLMDWAAITRGEYFETNSGEDAAGFVTMVLEDSLRRICPVDCDNNETLDWIDIDADPDLDVDPEDGLIDSCFPCAADCAPDNGDGTFGNGIVNVDDLLAVINGFGTCPTPPTLCPCDVTPVPGNGVVNVDDLLITVSSFGPCIQLTCPGPSSILKVQSMDFTSGYTDETGTVVGDVTAVANEWATFDDDWDVYRVWVEVPDSFTKLDGIGASEDDNDPVMLLNAEDDYFNETTAGGNFAPNPALFATYPQLAFDSFVTIGNATSAGGNPSVQGTLDLTKNTTQDDISWYRSGGVSPVAGGSTGWRVLVGQFTVPDGETFSGALRIIGDGIDEYETFTSDP